MNDIENGFFKYWIAHADEIKTLEKNTKSAHETNVLADILLKSINSDARKNWDLQKIIDVKEMILKTGLGEEPDDFFWEQESKLLVKEKRNSEALEIFNKRMAKDIDNTTASLYDIEFYLNTIEWGDGLKLIKARLDQLSKKVMNKNDNARLMFCHIFYYKKVNDMAEAKKFYRQAVNYYKANNINADKLKALLN